MEFSMYALKILLSTSSKNSLEEKNRDCITDLKFIGTIQSGEKLDVKNRRIETDKIYTPIKRLFFGESRDTLYVFVNNTIDRIFEIITSKSNSENISDKYMCKNIINDLVKSVVGLKNIQKTYKEDKRFSCNIETIIETIQAKLTELKIKHNDIFVLETFEEESKVTSLPEEKVTPPPESKVSSPPEEKIKKK
jgi:hypothetical protein